MFAKLWAKLQTLADHHQAIIAAIVTFSIVCVTWGIEKILEKFVFPEKSIWGYVAAVILGILLLWVTQHYILHVV
jgi:hypothetical protein